MKESLCGHTEGRREQVGRAAERETSMMDLSKTGRYWRGEHMKEERSEGKNEKVKKVVKNMPAP